VTAPVVDSRIRVVRAQSAVVIFAMFWVACSDVEGELSITFPSEAATAATSEIAVTAFVPLKIVEGASVPKFVEGRSVGVFPPVRHIDPETIETSPNLDTVLRFRNRQPYPFEDAKWNLELGKPDETNPNNPWGATMLYVEARGDARRPDARASNVTATLLAGTLCLRTKEASHLNGQLDRAVKDACQLLSDPQDAVRVVNLEPVAPDAFVLAPCDGRGTLAGAKNQRLAPGPAVCLSALRCEDQPGGMSGCFSCEQSIVECDDLSNVPILFTVEQANGAAGPLRQIVLTDGQGRAEAPIDLDACESEVHVTAQVLGRTTPPVEYAMTCVDSIESFACTSDVPLGDGFTPASSSVLPGDPAACAAGDVDACDQVAIVRDDTISARLELWHPARAQPIVQALPDRTAVAVHGFHYEEATAVGRPAARPMVAVATTGRDAEDSTLRVYVFELVDGTLVPHDGATGALPTLCSGWFCGSNAACDPGACASGEICYEGVCVEEDATAAMCPGPAGCVCEIDAVRFRTRVDIVARDRDDDGLADLTVASESGPEVLLHLTSRAAPGALFGLDTCECGRYGAEPRAIALGAFGGDAPNPTVPDLFIGGLGGSVLKYGRRLANGRSSLQCGGTEPLGDAMSVRDLASGAFSCALGDPSCNTYDDVFSVAELNVGGSGPDDPGVIRVLYGSARDSSEDGLQLSPRAFEGRALPVDPQRVQLGDFNADRHLDAAVLYRASGEIHVWLGASNAALGEVERGVVVEDCNVARSDNCTPLEDFAAGDFDGDGATELAVVCNASREPTLRFFAPVR
jgi:hypothetical protein